jgi:hypothetical protein
MTPPTKERVCPPGELLGAPLPAGNDREEGVIGPPQSEPLKIAEISVQRSSRADGAYVPGNVSIKR